MSSVETRWGYDLWNEYDSVLKHVHGNIELVELVQKINQDRILIEQSYAQKLKKLVRKHSLKDANFSGEKAVSAYLNEVGNVAVQHERLAANLEASVVKETAYVSQEWRKTHKVHQMDGIRLDKTMKSRCQAIDSTIKKYKDAHQEMLRAQEAFAKADEDRKLSRAEVDKAKNNALLKRQEFDRLKADYAAQRQDFNAFQRDHYQQQLPSIFKDLEQMDATILSKLNGFLYKAGVSESTVANDLMHNYEAISKCAEIISWNEDAELVLANLKNDAVPPGDRPFVDLDLESPSSSIDNVSNGQGAGSSISGRSPGASLSSRSSTKKDRPVKFLRGLFNGSVSGASASLSSGPGRQKDLDDSLTSPRPERKQSECQVEDIETEIRRAEKQKAALEKLIQMQEQNQKTCDMDQVRVEMAQIEGLLADLQARQARGEQELAGASRKVTKSRSMPSLNDIKRRARLSFRRKKTHRQMNGGPGEPAATSSPRRSGYDGATAYSDEEWTDEDDDDEFGPRDSSHHYQESSLGNSNSLVLRGNTMDETSTDPDNGYITPRVQPHCPPAPDQFADEQYQQQQKQQQEQEQAQQQQLHQLQLQQQQLQRHIQQEMRAQQQEIQAAPQQESAAEDVKQYHYIGAAVAVYPFEDKDDPAILSMKADDQFYVFHRDDDWTYVIRVDGSAKGMVPTSYLNLHMY